MQGGRARRAGRVGQGSGAGVRGGHQEGCHCNVGTTLAAGQCMLVARTARSVPSTWRLARDTCLLPAASLGMSAGCPSGSPVPASAGTSGCCLSSQGGHRWSRKPPGVAKHTSLQQHGSIRNTPHCVCGSIPWMLGILRPHSVQHSNTQMTHGSWPGCWLPRSQQHPLPSPCPRSCM
jgi:hypothetical protein